MLLLPVFLPLLGGFVTMLYPSWTERVRNTYTFVLACLNSFVLLALILLRTQQGPDDPEIVIYSFTAGFEVALRLDSLGALFAGMLALMWPPALLYAFSYMQGESEQRPFFSFYLMTYGVAVGIAFAGNLVTMYVFFEMLTLVTVPLVTQYMDAESLGAGQRYMAYCIAGASLGFVAVVIGTLDGIGDFRYGGNLAGRFPRELMRAIYLIGFFGFGTKAAIFPLHRWLPSASVAPTPVTALLHAVAVVNTGFFAVARLTWYAFGPGLLQGSWVQVVCVCVSAFSVVFAAAMALKQRHFKRRLAYSTMSNLSYMLLGLSLMSPAGFYGSISHMLCHGVIKMSLFLCAGAAMHVSGRAYIYELDGLGWQMPFTFAAYTAGSLSLTGIPLFCGFLSKWRLLTAGVAAGTWYGYLACGALLTAALLCAIYTLSVSIRAFFPVDRQNSLAIHEADWRMLTPIGLFTVLNLALGVAGAPVFSLLEQIAQGVI